MYYTTDYFSTTVSGSSMSRVDYERLKERLNKEVKREQEAMEEYDRYDQDEPQEAGTDGY